MQPFWNPRSSNPSPLALDIAALTLANGADNNLAIGSGSRFRIVGPTGAFSISGFVAPTGSAGQVLYLYNSVAQNMTITHDATSTAANRILTYTGADIATTGIGTAMFIYSATDSRWILMFLSA